MSQRAHAGSAHDPDLAAVSVLVGKFSHQSLCAGQFARQRVADTYRDGRRRCLAFLDHIEVRVKCRNFIDFGLGQSQFFGEGREMGCRQTPVSVLDQVKKLDEEIPPSRPVS